MLLLAILSRGAFTVLIGGLLTLAVGQGVSRTYEALGLQIAEVADVHR